MRTDVFGGRPGDERAFIHKKLLPFISKVAGVLPIPGAGVISKVAGAFGGRPSATTAAQRQFGLDSKFGGQGFTLGVTGTAPRGDGCFPGFRRPPGGGPCRIFLGDRPGPDGDLALGDPVLGQYGAGMTPGNMIIDRAVCGRSMQLGNDGICYNKSQISNKQRMWPAGHKPLLSGGDMSAISTAARAGKRLEVATKRLQKMGMMKKPVSRRGPTRHAALLEGHVRG